MAGGSGTRFWPASRKSFPKQFLALGGSEKSLIKETYERMEKVTGQKSIMVVTADTQQALVVEHIPDSCILSEPMPRNTAACLAYSALYVLESVGDVPMVCVPADHHIEGIDSFKAVVRDAIEIASSRDVFVTCLLYTSPSPRDATLSRMPSSA